MGVLIMSPTSLGCTLRPPICGNSHIEDRKAILRMDTGSHANPPTTRGTVLRLRGLCSRHVRPWLGKGGSAKDSSVLFKQGPLQTNFHRYALALVCINADQAEQMQHADACVCVAMALQVSMSGGPSFLNKQLHSTRICVGLPYGPVPSLRP